MERPQVLKGETSNFLKTASLTPSDFPKKGKNIYFKNNLRAPVLRK